VIASNSLARFECGLAVRSIIAVSLISALATHGAESLDREGLLWSPYLEWKLENADYPGNPFDLEATVVFTHKPSGETRRTGMFFDGDTAWKFRFTGTRTGQWSFVTHSKARTLDGKSGTVKITAAKPELSSRGFVTSVDGNRWGWQSGATGELVAFVPQLVMGRDLSAYRQTSKIDGDVRTWLVEHGFNGIHIAVLCRWFDFDQVSADKIDSADPNPDPRTFRILEELINRFHRAGGLVHIWDWGDDSRHMTPLKWGINGRADKRLQRYIGARLGPLPGWTMSYGFDLWEWVDGKQLAEWHGFMHQHFGWPHLLGGRWEKNQLTQATEVLDYAAYEQHQPDYHKYVETIEKRPGKPAFSEDRFRVRRPSPYPEKDYDLERTRRGLWHSTMAGGVANIWGYLVPTADEGGSRPYPNRDQIKTWAHFFQHRFRQGMRRANHLTDGVALSWKGPNQGLLVLYKEQTDAIRLDLSEFGVAAKAVAVDAKKPYREIDLGALKPEEQTWRAPYNSDWAIAVGEAPRP
jgi:hypothetical protein